MRKKLAVEAEHSRLAAELEAYLSEHQRDASTLAELAESVSQTTRDLEQARNEEISLRSKMEALRREYSGSMARKEALEQSLARHAYSTESVRRLLSGENSANGHTFQPMGLLADFVEVSSGYEEVVEEFLKQELECVVVGQYAQARSGIALLQSQGTGRSTFFVTHLPSNGHAHGDRDSPVRTEPGVVAAIRELVRFESKLGLNGDLVLPALASAYLVQDDAAAERLASAYPDCHFLTATGAHYHHRMVSGGKGSSAGPLALRRDFRELERRTAELETQIRSSEAALAEAEVLAKRLGEQLKTLTGSKMEAEKKAVVADEKLRQTRETCDRTRQQLDTLLAEAALLKSERARAEERQAALHSNWKPPPPPGRNAKRPSIRPPNWRANSARAWTGWRRISPTPNPLPGAWKKDPARQRRKQAGCGHRRWTFITALPGWPNKRKSGNKSASAWHRNVTPISFACNKFNSSWRRRELTCTAWRRNPARSGPSAIPWARAWTRHAPNSRPGAKSAPRRRWRWRALNPTTPTTRSNAAMN